MDLAAFTKWPIVKFLEERGWLYFPPMAYDDYLIFTHSKRQLVLHVYSDKVVFLHRGNPLRHTRGYLATRRETSGCSRSTITPSR
jgi:hypothetical protein